MKNIVSIIVLATIFCSCVDKKEKDELNDAKKPSTAKREYVYVDDKGCIHLQRDCIVFFEDSGNYAIRRFPISEVNACSNIRCCSMCVTDEDFNKWLHNDSANAEDEQME